MVENSASRCKELDIPFYRFNPELNEIIPAGETDNVKLMNMVMETKIQIKEQKLKEMIEILQMITATSSDICPPKPAATPPSPKEDHSPVEKTQTTDRRKVWQVPQFSITTEDDPEEKDLEDEELDQLEMNDHYNEMLNESLVHPEGAQAQAGDEETQADNFSDTDDKKELSDTVTPTNHYQLEVDEDKESSFPQQPANLYLLETAT